LHDDYEDEKVTMIGLKKESTSSNKIKLMIRPIYPDFMAAGFSSCP
jgi:hypothetical protein